MLKHSDPTIELTRDEAEKAKEAELKKLGHSWPPKSASDLLNDYEHRLRNRELPQLYIQGQALNGIEVGPGLVCVLGAPPGAGKTALTMQILFDTLELNEGTRAVLAITDTGIDSVFRRQLVRMTGIASRKIRFGDLDDSELEQVSSAIKQLKKRLQRVRVIEEPSVALLDILSSEEPGLLIVDYVQQFAPSDKDLRSGVNAVMARLRKLAQAKWAVLAISATKRDGNGKHESKDLGLASFRESGGIEYDADSAYVMKDSGPVDGNESVRSVCVECVKNRHDVRKNFDLHFDRDRMDFSLQFNPDFPNDFGKLADQAEVLY